MKLYHSISCSMFTVKFTVSDYKLTVFLAVEADYCQIYCQFDSSDSDFDSGLSDPPQGVCYNLWVGY